jgi:stearoyl-CoA desaturase (Delta-9 desaturase)
MPTALFEWLTHGFTQASYGQMAFALLLVCQLTMMSSTLYLHRSATHRGVDFHPLIAHWFRLWNWLSTGMVVKEWVAVHRKHHAKCETVDDPHSPRFKGLSKVLWEGVDLYRDASSDKTLLEQYGKGTPEDWIERHVYTPHSRIGVSLLAIIYIALFGVPGIVIWTLHMCWMPFHGAGVINGIGHWWGYRNFDTHDSATNISPWGLWIGGEELHNNHHAFPSSAKFSLRKYEIDIGWCVIAVLAKLKLAKVLRVAPALDLRPNIHVPDAETLRAVMTHRWQVATDYFHIVLKPQLKQDAINLPRRLRKAFRSEGKWLDNMNREKLAAFVQGHPNLNRLMAYRQALLAIFELKSAEVDAKMQALKAWCADAEASGIDALAVFSHRLKAYALAPAHN